ncbi:MAG: ubiquitin-like protein Pup [Actinomycetota bacterium]
MPQEQEQRRTQRRAEGAEAEETESSSAASGERLKAEMDGILDEIDAVLEENAEEFVKGYVQKGGQ